MNIFKRKTKDWDLYIQRLKEVIKTTRGKR